MHTEFQCHYTTSIKAPIERVWEALTNPSIVKQYFFGTDLVTSWQIGGAIEFRGEWEEQSYSDKGIILEYEQNKKLAYSYLSNWSGLEDHPDNYLWVCYEVQPFGAETKLTIHQSNYDQERANHSEASWASIVVEMKKLGEV
jgi:uncharacterized protein YndB with AHSA1/START domain